MRRSAASCRLGSGGGGPWACFALFVCKRFASHASGSPQEEEEEVERRICTSPACPFRNGPFLPAHLLDEAIDRQREIFSRERTTSSYTGCSPRCTQGTWAVVLAVGGTKLSRVAFKPFPNACLVDETIWRSKDLSIPPVYLRSYVWSFGHGVV